MSYVPTPIRYLKSISRHVEKYFGRDSFVLHEHESHTVHIDLHVVAPNAVRPHFTLLTSGMSDLDMHPPEGLENHALAELCLCLPPSWPLSMTNFGWREPNYFWPISLLKGAARFPHEHKTWFSRGHSLSGADGFIPRQAAVGFTAVYFTIPQNFPDGADQLLTAEDGRSIQFLAAIPLFPQELAFKEKHGAEAFEEELQAAGINELVDPHRASVLPHD